MKLRDYAKKKGVHYRTAYRWYKDGKIRGYQMDTGTIIITEDEPTPQTQQVAIYARLYGQHRAKRKTERITQELIRDDHATG